MKDKYNKSKRECKKAGNRIWKWKKTNNKR